MVSTYFGQPPCPHHRNVGRWLEPRDVYDMIVDLFYWSDCKGVFCVWVQDKVLRYDNTPVLWLARPIALLPNYEVIMVVVVGNSMCREVGWMNREIDGWMGKGY